MNEEDIDMGEARLKEQLKQEQFAANPDDFINVKDCLFVVQRRGSKEYGVLNNCASIEDVFMVDGFAREALQNRRDQIRMMQIQKKQQSGIIIADRIPQNGNGKHA